MLKKEEIIVFDHVTQKDVIATFISSDEEKGLVWSKIAEGNFTVSNSRDVMARNTEENIKKVLLGEYRPKQHTK